MSAGLRRLGWLGMVVTLWGCVATSVHSEGAGAKTAPEAESRPWLGVARGKSSGGGVPVKRVFRGSPADTVGLSGGDLIKKVDGQGVLHPGEVSAVLFRRRPGDVVEIEYERGGQPRKASARLEVFPGGDEVLRRERVGGPAPALQGLAPVQGEAPLTIEGLRGKVVVLDFWASWCVVCRKTVPYLNRWHETFAGRGLVVLGVSSDDRAGADKGIASFGIRYPVAIDEEELVFSGYGAASLPTLFVIDKRGVVRAVEVGFGHASLRVIERLLGELLEEG